MNWIQPRVAAGQTLVGTWIASGSSVLAEIASQVGFDWVLLDMEHGLGDWGELRQMLQAASNTACAPIVRVGSCDEVEIKRALDLGAAGIMIPMVNTPEQAAKAVAAMRYPPDGIRGVASSIRAVNYGLNFTDYFAQANDKLLTICQIETAQGVKNAAQIAAVDGVDILFVGLADLSLDLGHYKELDHPIVTDAVRQIVEACQNAGKHCGTLLSNPNAVPNALAQGMTFIGMGVDTTTYREAIKTTLAGFEQMQS